MAKYNIKTVAQKEAILKYYWQHGWKPTGKKYNIPRGSVMNWEKQLKTEGSLERRPKTHTVRQETVTYVRQLHKKYPDATIAEVRDMACKKQKISRTTVWLILTGNPKYL